MPLPEAAFAAGPTIIRAGIGAGVAILIALAAVRSRSLSPSGGVAAVVVGTICSAAGTAWAAMIILFFITSTALGRVRADLRARRIGSIVQKGGARDAGQVLANGGVFTAAALGHLMHPSTSWLALAGGALAAAAADTWSTEIGSLASRQPRDILRWTVVAPGTSGGVTLVGTLASVAGGLFIATMVAIAGWSFGVAIATLVGGVAGAFADSILGAAVQLRRWCDRCESPTEQDVHVCGTATRISGGIAWIDNDMVNLLSVVLGGLISLLVFAAIR